MTTTRPTIIQTIETAVKNPDIKQHIKEKPANRIFDYIPNLLPAAELKPVCTSFEKIVNQVAVVNDTPQLTKAFISDLKNWVKSIAARGCQELLDKNGNVKPEIISLLELQHKKVFSSDIVMAYLGTITMQVTKNMENFIETHNMATAITLDYINKYYHQWSIEEAKRLGYSLQSHPDTKDRVSNPPLINTSHLKKSAIAIGVIAGLAAGIALGLKFFKEASPPAPIELQDFASGNTALLNPNL